MHRLLVPFLVVATLFAADGPFTGRWTSTRNEGTGDIRIAFKPEPQVTFTINGREYKPTVANPKIEGSSFAMDWDFEMDRYKLRSSAKGEIKGARLEGSYQTRVVTEGTTIDEGKFDGQAGKQ